MIIDAHIHLWEKIAGKIANEISVSPLKNGRVRIGDREVLGMPPLMLDCAARAELALSEFDAAGVDAAVVVQEFMDGEQNEYLRRVSTQYPGRLLAHGLPNYWDLAGVQREAEQLLAAGFCGLKLPAEHLVGKIRLDDLGFMPIWEFLEASGRVLAVDLCEGDRQVDEMASIIEQCPSLRIAIGHFGMPNRGGWPGQLRLARLENVYLETGGIVWLYRHEGFPFPGASQVIRQAMQEVGAEKLMWGSDWPRTMIDFTYRQSLEFVRDDSKLSDAEKQLILGDNARRLYGLEESTQQRSPIPAITED